MKNGTLYYLDDIIKIKVLILIVVVKSGITYVICYNYAKIINNNFNNGICFLLVVIDIFRIYDYVVSLKDYNYWYYYNKGKAISNAFAQRFIATLNWIEWYWMHDFNVKKMIALRN